MGNILDYLPYKNYIGNFYYIDNFVDITGLSYSLTKQLLEKHQKDSLKKIKLPDITNKEFSYSMADVNVEEVNFVCGWVSFQKYAEKTEASLEKVKGCAERGELGPVQKHPKTNEEMVIWPTEYQSKPLEALPKCGKSKFTSTIKITANAPVPVDISETDKFEENQKLLLRLAHAVGDKEEVSTKAETMLYQSSFLLQWTAFEVFIRESIHELFRRHPSKLTKGQRGSTTSISYKDVFEFSQGFQSIDSLRISLIEGEIEKHKKDGASISGLINFLKSEFKFKNDPYMFIAEIRE